MSEPLSPLDDSALPVSARVRARLQRAKQRYHANDNIAAYIDPSEIDALHEEVASKFQAVLESLVIDTLSDHNTRDTARRVAKMYLTEVFRGRYEAAPPVTEFPNAERLNELMIVGPITVPSQIYVGSYCQPLSVWLQRHHQTMYVLTEPDKYLQS